VRSINLLFLFGIRRNCLRSGRNRSLYLSLRKVIKQVVVNIGAPTYKILSNILLSRLIPYAGEITGDINVEFDETGQILIIYSAFENT